MPFVKVQKNKAYFSRFQVKFRRRRQGKTDYARRRKMVVMDKNKYNAPRNRLVVRITNRDVIAQVVRSHVKGDEVLTAAYAHELGRYGLKNVGYTNYASAYCVGLLVGRRLLQKYGMDKLYRGAERVDGNDYYVKPAEDGPNPFLLVLDVGLRRTSTGARIFAVMKGCADAGVEVPHSESRFVGYDSEKGELDAEVLRAHIFGQHVADYMRSLKEEDPERFKQQFRRYIKAGVKPNDIESMYRSVHKAIRANPQAKKKEFAKDHAWFPMVRIPALTLKQRKEKLAAKKAAHAASN